MSGKSAMVRPLSRVALAVTAGLALVLVAGTAVHAMPVGRPLARLGPTAVKTSTPIQHLVVIFQENESFDHYFGVYPHALNPTGEPAFQAAAGTPTPNGLTTALLTHNPNAVNPKRLDRSQLFPCMNDHSYTGEQVAFDHGRMDRFVPATTPPGCTYGSTMDYYDGNTVTA